MRREYIYFGVIFSAIPFIAFGWHLSKWGEPPESAAILVYLPFWGAMLGSGMGGSEIIFLIATTIGLTLTLSIWFGIGVALTWIAACISKKYFLAITFVMLALIFYLTVVVPTQLVVESYNRQSGIGYTLEDCEKISPIDSFDRSMCIRSVRTRMADELNRWVIDHDAEAAKTYCNDIENDEGMRTSCWGAIGMFHPGSAYICASAVTQSGKNFCWYLAAEQLSDPGLCNKIQGTEMQENCRGHVEITRKDRTQSREQWGIRE